MVKSLIGGLKSHIEYGVFHFSATGIYPRDRCIKAGFASESKAQKVADTMNRKVPDAKFVVRKL